MKRLGNSQWENRRVKTEEVGRRRDAEKVSVNETWKFPFLLICGPGGF